MGDKAAISSNSRQSSELSPWACRKTGIPLFTAVTVPMPPSASLTRKASLDQALSEVVSGRSDRTPVAPSAATRRVGSSRIEINSSTSIAAPKIATSCSRRTILLWIPATVDDLWNLDQVSISVDSTAASSSLALLSSSSRLHSKCERISSCIGTSASLIGVRSVGLSFMCSPVEGLGEC